MLELCLDRMLPQWLERCLLPRELHGRRPLRGRRGQYLKHAVAENVESGFSESDFALRLRSFLLRRGGEYDRKELESLSRDSLPRALVGSLVGFPMVARTD